ncbi:MAG: SMC-Scp complex subunit ScpB [Oscillospiraceae bacterium]|nr:SMC-Scp complex subunit ScpB [Oscillospiraceae bacterium]
MEVEQIKPMIEAILFASGRVVDVKELMAIFELSNEEADSIVQDMKIEFENANRGIEIIKVEDGYQLCTKKEYYSYIYPLFDSKIKPTLSNAALEVLSIIAYNPKITRSEIEQIRGVNSDGTMYKLLQYELIEEAGKLNLPGKPMGYRTTEEFLKVFGVSSLEELPELPKYKLDENEQLVLENA